MANGVSPESVGFSSQRLSRINKMMQGYIDDGKLASGLTMLARRGETFHFEPYGVLDLESGTPVERDTLFRIYSMSKPITSAAVMMLYEEGHFSLDDPVGKFIPELASLKVYDGMSETGIRLVEQQQPISIRHLLTHTSGLSYGFHEDSPVEQMYREANITDPDSTLQEMAEKLGKLPLVTQPGTKWRYSNATDVLGYLVEVVSGQPFDQFLQEKILSPLGMTDTSFYVSEENLDRLAMVYGASMNGGGIGPLNNPMVNRQTRPHTLFSGGGGLVSTGSDYMSFCQMLLNGGILGEERLLAPKTVEMMRSNHLADDLKPFAVGSEHVVRHEGVRVRSRLPRGHGHRAARHHRLQRHLLMGRRGKHRLLDRPARRPGSHPAHTVHAKFVLPPAPRVPDSHLSGADGVEDEKTAIYT